MPIVEELLELEGARAGELDPAAVSPSRVVLKSLTVVDFADHFPDFLAESIQVANTTPWWKQPWIGTVAQWAAIAVMFILFVLPRWWDYISQNSDLRLEKMISAQVTPAIAGVNAHIDQTSAPITRQLTDLSNRVTDLTGRIGNVEGQLSRIRTTQGKQVEQQKQFSARLDQQEALNRIQDPDRILGIIRTDIKLAQDRQGPPSSSQLADYKAALHALPSSAKEYWATVAEIINYQSLVNQMSGEAPDPTKIARPCITGGGGGVIRNNSYIGGIYTNCIVDLDTQSFQNVTFQNSVVRYRGGPVSLMNVRFINCRFDLSLSAEPVTPAQQNLLLALLNSTDQKNVQLPATQN